MLSLGHKKIAHLAGVKGIYTAERRLLGYKKAIMDGGMPYQPKLVSFTDYRLEGGYNAAANIIEKGLGITAIFAANDYIGIGALSYLLKKGFKIPEDISIIGFAGDDICEYTTPPLTTMVQPIEEIGEIAVEYLIGIKKMEEKVDILLPARLKIRDSCKAVLKNRSAF